MLGYGCGVYQCTKLCDKDLDRYQVLQSPYIGYFEGFPVDKFIKNGVLYLADQAEKFS